MIPTTESACQKFFLNMCLSANLPIMFLGPTGTGKSCVVLNHLMTMPKEKFLPNVLNFSAQTSAYQVRLFQDHPMIISKISQPLSQGSIIFES